MWKRSAQKENIRGTTARNVIQSSNPMAAPGSKQPAHKATFSSALISPTVVLTLGPVTLALSVLPVRWLPDPGGCPILPAT